MEVKISVNGELLDDKIAKVDDVMDMMCCSIPRCDCWDGPWSRLLVVGVHRM